MLKAHSALRIIDGFATFVKTALIIASTQVSIFTFALYRKFSSIDADSLSFQQWQSIVIQTWESTTVNKVQMYLIVLIYLVIAIPLTIKTSRDNKQSCCKHQSHSAPTVRSLSMKTDLFRYVQLSLGALTVAFLVTVTTKEVTLVFTTTAWLFFFIALLILLLMFIVGNAWKPKTSSLRAQVISMALLLLLLGGLAYYLTLPQFIANVAAVWVTLLVLKVYGSKSTIIVKTTTQPTAINQRVQECYQTECVAELKNNVESRVNYQPVAIDDEAQSGINSDSEKDVKN